MTKARDRMTKYEKKYRETLFICCLIVGYCSFMTGLLLGMVI